MVFTVFESVKERFRFVIPKLLPRPNSEYFLLELFYIYLIFILQESILPFIFPKLIHIDIITPWLTIIFIRQKLYRSVLFATFASYLLETHSSVPSGMFFCTYFISSVIIVYIRGALSWRHLIPWVVVYCISSLWVISFETFVFWYSKSINLEESTYWITQVSRLILSVIIGVQLGKEWIKIDAEEPIPQ